MSPNIYVDVQLGIIQTIKNILETASINFLIAFLASQARMILTMGRVRMHLLVVARSAQQEKAALRLLQSVRAASPVSTAMVWEIASNVPAANSRYRSEPRMLTRAFPVQRGSIHTLVPRLVLQIALQALLQKTVEDASGACLESSLLRMGPTPVISVPPGNPPTEIPGASGVTLVLLASIYLKREASARLVKVANFRT